MEQKIENGKMDIMGINIDISQVLGQKIIDQYIAQLSDDNIKEIMKYISSDLFSKQSVYNRETNDYVDKLVVKKREKISGEIIRKRRFQSEN